MRVVQSEEVAEEHQDGTVAVARVEQCLDSVGSVTDVKGRGRPGWRWPSVVGDHACDVLGARGCAHRDRSAVGVSGCRHLPADRVGDSGDVVVLQPDVIVLCVAAHSAATPVDRVHAEAVPEEPREGHQPDVVGPAAMDHDQRSAASTGRPSDPGAIGRAGRRLDPLPTGRGRVWPGVGHGLDRPASGELNIGCAPDRPALLFIATAGSGRAESVRLDESVRSTCLVAPRLTDLSAGRWVAP